MDCSPLAGDPGWNFLSVSLEWRRIKPMKTRMRKRTLFIVLILLLAIGWAMGQFDYARLVAGKKPFFARLQLYCDDGGSIEYWGLGYTVTDLHRFEWGGNGIRPDARFVGSNMITPFRVGPTLDYWTPFMSRENTRFVVETNKMTR
jgi:hypothetical protein